MIKEELEPSSEMTETARGAKKEAAAALNPKSEENSFLQDNSRVLENSIMALEDQIARKKK